MKIYRNRPWDPKRAEKIRQMRSGGMTLMAISKVFGLSELRVFKILRPEVNRAHVAVYDAIKSGRLVRPKCCSVCFEPHSRIQAHHDDYDKPLEVRWLCHPCHKKADSERRAAAQMEAA